MARLARRQNAQFCWCFLPRPAGAAWSDELSVRNIKSFLKAASYREMSMEDLDEARRAWEHLRPKRPGDRGCDFIPWAIGAGAPPQLRPADLAVEAAPAALLFDVRAPRPAEPRVARVRIRQKGHDRGAADISFPDDRICLSALNDPFRPAEALAPGAGPPSGRRPTPQGWEPRYFAIGSTGDVLVRYHSSLLLLVERAQGKSHDSWLISLPEDAKIAGVLHDAPFLSIVLQRTARGEQMLVHRQFNLYAGGRMEGPGRSTHMLSTHLFRKQPDNALPILLRRAAWMELSTASGQCFRLDAEGDRKMRFQMLYAEPKTVYATGPYRVVRVKHAGESVYRVLKNQKAIDDYPQTVEHAAAPHAVLYTPQERGLAYSVSPGRWMVPLNRMPFRSDAVPAELTLVLEPHEALLSVNRAGDRLGARIWSDARYGGEGTVRFVRDEGGVRSARQATLKLADDALRIVDIKLGNNGLWALALDDQAGGGSELLHYRYRKRRSAYECARLDLDRFASEATTIPAEVFDD
ncbi:MAG TPA: hypothetical protein VF727_15380 [Allosphingosinicella sp.]